MIWQKKKAGVVFLKEDNEFNEFIEKVKKFSESVYGEPKEELDKKISLWEAGCKGENDTKYHLQYGRTDMYVLRDIYLKAGDMSAQIDYLLITRKYVYLLECKNWTGTVTVDKTGRFFKKSESIFSEPVASPLVQSDQHLKVVETVGKALGAKLNWRYRILVVFTNNKICLNTQFAKQANTEPLVCLEQLNVHLQRDDSLARISNLSDKEMKKIAEFFLEQQTASSYYAEKYEELTKKYPVQTEEEIARQKEEEIARQKEAEIARQKEEEIARQKEAEIARQKEAEIARQKEAEESFLRQELYKFRRAVYEAENIPPYCVMNNSTIEELIEKRPRTKEELLAVKGMGSKNVAKYGTAILYILDATIKTKGENK